MSSFWMQLWADGKNGSEDVEKQRDALVPSFFNVDNGIPKRKFFCKDSVTGNHPTTFFSLCFEQLPHAIDAKLIACRTISFTEQESGQGIAIKRQRRQLSTAMQRTMSSVYSASCLRSVFTTTTRPKLPKASQQNIPKLGMSFRSKHSDASLSFDKINITDISAKPAPRKPTDQTQYSNRTSSDLPSNKLTNSTSVSSTSTSTSTPTSGSEFDRRLQFLQGFQRRSEPSSPTSLPKPKKVQRRVLGKKYRHGFQRGDFMCPQCGSHNFRPPDHALIGPWTGARKSQDRVDKLALKAPSGSAKGSLSATVSILPSNHSHSLGPTAHPQGALAHCFECGFESTYKDSTSSLSSRSKSRHPTGPRIAQHRGENDLRLSNPREYVCTSCQTVNYSGRIHCVGCGTLAPWIRDMVERGI